MPPRDPGLSGGCTGPLLTPRGRVVAALLFTLLLLAVFAWGAADPSFWSAC